MSMGACAQDPKHTPTAFVLGASADIGLALCERLIRDGWFVVGAARDTSRLEQFSNEPAFRALSCDLAEAADIDSMVQSFSALQTSWDLFVSAAGSMEPIGRFFDLDFDDWEASVTVNTTAQLRVLHGLWRHRNQAKADVMLMAGGGTNNPFPNYSAYCVSKIALIKMCELLDDEEDGLNIFIIGPGFVQTRIHEETLRAGARAGDGYRKTVDFLTTEGTSMDDIYDNLLWCVAQGKAVAGGRNFSTVHDPWRGGGDRLREQLQNDANAFRLRRAQP